MRDNVRPDGAPGPGAGDSGSWLLGHGVKNLLRCDEAETVRGIARYVISKHYSLRAGSDFMERSRENSVPPYAAYLGAATRFLEVREPDKTGGAVWVARLGNERRELEKLPRLLPELGWTEFRLARPPDASALLSFPRGLFPHRRRVRRLARLLLARGHEFFRVLRAAELFGYYARYLDIFRRGNFRLAAMSSHSNPHGIAFNLAARRCGVPVVLVTHGMPVRPVARLAYDLAVVHCEDARRTYLEEGCRVKRFIIHGRRQDYRPMPAAEELPAKLTVGIFLCKDVNERRLRRLTERLLASGRVSRILVRPHPKNLFRELDAWLASLDDPRVEKTDSRSPAADDLARTDVVLGGNSSVLIEAVTAGRPAGYVRGLDHGSEDLHRLVARGLVCPVGDDFDFDRMPAFYRRAEWSTVLRLFANIDEDEAEVSGRLKDALREVILPASAACPSAAADGRA